MDSYFSSSELLLCRIWKLTAVHLSYWIWMPTYCGLNTFKLKKGNSLPASGYYVYIQGNTSKPLQIKSYKNAWVMQIWVIWWQASTVLLRKHVKTKKKLLFCWFTKQPLMIYSSWGANWSIKCREWLRWGLIPAAHTEFFNMKWWLAILKVQLQHRTIHHKKGLSWLENLYSLRESNCS